RLDQLIRLQRKITTQKKTDMLGHTYTLIPETSSKHSDNDWLGRTETDHTVVFPKKNSILGEPVKVRIVKLEGSTLIGCITDNE
ncbi:TRAM domain-containing protein, partial [bacterium]|nr:TRAM domain-containing protein [bacterium]